MARQGPPRPGLLADYIDRLQGTGRYCFVTEQVESETRLGGVALDAALRRLRAAARIASPRRGFHVIVPAEYRSAGAPPPSWFIDDLMRFLGQPYYVGLLSAAALHGAAHQQPMVFQVLTDRPTRPARAGQGRIVFHEARDPERIPVIRVQTETGTMRVSSPEATAFDLVRYPAAAGHLDNVATVLGELGEVLAGEALVALAPLHSLPDVQRLGYLLDLVGEAEKAEGLAAWLRGRRQRPVLLAKGQRSTKREADPRWRVIPNVMIEVDT